MRTLALVIAIYTPVMLLIHVSTGKILIAWNEQPDSRTSRWFTPRRALRVEGAFWLLALAAYFLWQSLAWKILVIAFAAIHLGIWATGEFRSSGEGGSVFGHSPAISRAIVAFDAVEAVVLVGIGAVAVLYLTHA